MPANFTARSRNSQLLSLLSILLLGAAFAVEGNAQSTSATSGYTPAGLAPGTPAGSYALSGFDNINPYNGGMNFSLPLLQVGGRGSAQYTMQLPIEQKWRATHDEICDPQTNQCWMFDTPDYNAWGAIPGYKAGVMNARKIGLFPQTCDYNGSQFTTFTYTLTRLTFTTPDGTEYELRDQWYGGQQLTNPSPCNQNPPSRGTIFVTADGTSATFISDTAIYDDLTGGSYDYPSGYLAFRDGTRYRIDAGEVSWMRDRNGNKLTFNGISSTDSLNRQVTVEGLTDVAPYGLCDRITTSGYGGASRVIRVSWKPLGEVLRSGYALSTYSSLWPELNNASSYSYHNPTVVSAVWLPNGQSYKFFYNNYGELARVELPTGGAFEYDWAAGMTGGSTSGAYFPMSPSLFIYRRVIERRVYANGGTGSNYDTKMTISRPESYPNFTRDAYVEVKQYKSGNVFQAGTRHYYETGAAATILAGTNNPLGYTSWRDAKEWQTETLASDGSTVLRRENRTWQQRAPISWYTGPPEGSPPNDPRLTESVTTFVDSNQISKQTFGYDQYNNQTDVYEYDFGSGGAGALQRHTHTDYLTAGYDTNTNIHIRNKPTLVRINNPSGQQVSRTEYLYDQVGYPLVWYGNVTGWIDPGSSRGNATTTRRWVDTTGSYIETHAQPDQVGNVRYAWDARGNLSQFEYNDSFSDGNNNRGTFAYPTKLISPVPDPGNTGFGSATSLTSHRVYDFSTGLLTSFTDANGKVTGFEYNDPFDRPTRVNRPDTGWTTYAYDRNQYGEYVHTQGLQNTAGTVMSSYQFFDKLGRPYRTFQYENYDGAKPWLTVDTQYDAMGRAWRVSQQYRSSGSASGINPSGKWTESEFDSLGRVKTVTTRPDNAVSSISYSGNTVTATDQDQVGKSRRTVTDALGRLTQAVEDPNGVGYVTDYTYDVLGNLRRVNQGGQYRYFMYDSVGRLIRAKNPEQAAGTIASNITDSVTGNGQWSLAYGYDDNGNLTARVDARGITTTYAYDSLNRNTTVRYTDGTKDIDRHYDGAINGRGRFYYSNWDANNNTRFDTHLAIDEYDVAGRPKIYRQHFLTNGVASGAFTVTRNYDLAGNVISQGYPSGRGVSYAYDIAGRLNGFSGNLGDNQQRSYSTGILYDETGGMRQEQFGTDTPIYNKHLYNNRGQLSEIRVSTHSILTPGQETNWNRGAIINHYSHQSWAGSGTENNGNLKKQEVYIPHDDQVSNYTMWWQEYNYDSLNRLNWVREISGASEIWKQDFDYDRWGNRTFDQNSSWGGVPEPAFAVDTATNRLGVPGGYSGTMSYDQAGNLTNDTYTGQGTRSYDAENRMVSAQDVYGQTTTYTYDADGRRVRGRVAAGAEVWQVYGMDGELLGEYAAGASASTPQKEYGYRGGELLVQALAPVSSGTGLTGQYFDNMNFGNLKLTRTDATVDFDWGGGTPHSSIGVDTFTVRWAGKVEPLYSQTYTFYTTTDDGVRLWVNNQLIIDKWIDQGPTEWSGQITLTAGQRYDIRMEFYENGGGAMAKLFWSSASQAKQAIQQSQLYPTTAANAQVDFQWMVNDQLGSPRMVIEKTGSLAGVKRRDFLPFGEDLQTGGRTWQLGYVADSVRQKFTGYERDSETNLDYAHARYFSSGQGRFTGVDPYDINIERQHSADREEADARFRNYISLPQHWNRYAYALNNPLRYVDPDGLYEYPAELLGKKIKVHIDDSIINNKKDPDALKRIQSNLQKAFDKINAGADKLTKEQIQSIGSMKGISVSNIARQGMNGGTFQIKQTTAENPNLDNLAAAIIHDSRHGEQFKRGLSYTDKTAIPMEMEASQFTVDVMKATGGWKTDTFKGYEDDAATGHLPPGMTDKSTPKTREKVFSTMKKPRK